MISAERIGVINQARDADRDVALSKVVREMEGSSICHATPPDRLHDTYCQRAEMNPDRARLSHL